MNAPNVERPMHYRGSIPHIHTPRDARSNRLFLRSGSQTTKIAEAGEAGGRTMKKFARWAIVGMLLASVPQ